MSGFIMNTNTETVTATRDMELKMKVAAAAGNTTTVTKDVAVNTVTVGETAPSAEVEKAAAETETADTAIAEEAAGSDEVIAAEEAGEVAPVESVIAEEGVVTDMVEEGTIIAEPAPGFDGNGGGDIGFDEGMYMDPTMETGMAEVKDPLLSSWPFVIGISAVVLLVSMTLGALLARRKIKKGIELYED